VYLQKPDGGQRPIGVLCVRDRVVQSACLLLLDPIFDPTFSHFSFAFRPRRSAHQAIAVARGMIAAGHAWAVTADIRKCFDRIDHEILLGLLAQRVGDPALLELIRHWLTAEVLELGELQPVELGVPQGAVISPLLANIYLDPLDQHLTRLHLPFVRYADDLLIFADDEASARRDLGVLGDFLREVLHLELKPSKVQHAPVADGVVFLGFTLRGRSIEIRADRLTRVAEEIRSLMATLGAPGSTFQDRVNAFGRIAAVTRGFRNYFLLPDEPVIADQLGGVDGQLEMAAHELLPQAMREDPAWICRERFAQSGPALESQPAGSTTSPESTYPRESVDEAPVPPRGEEAPGTGAPSTTPLVEPGADDGEADDHGLLLTDGRLFVMAHGLYLCLVKPDSLAVKKRKVELAAFPLADLQLIYLQGIGLNVSVELQLALAERDTLVIFAPPVGQPLAFLTPIHSHRAHLRGQQVLRREDPDLIAAGVAMVSAKTTNQAAVLRYFGKYKARQDPEGAEQLAGVAKAIRDLASRIESVDRSAANLRAMVMGLEGQAASMYWQQLVRLVPEGLQFDGRAHENATDPLNQAVNYLYGILYGEVWRAITSAGLDPYFGLIHGSQRNQGSLVFDLIEEFRAPFADRVLLALLGRGFRPETGRGGRLRSRVRRKLASAFNHRWHRPIRWHGRRIAPAGVLLEQARSLAKLIRREGAYQPYRMRW
jgi:group II intron reverse transcriptase/maturase/CRISPR-associated endonuclease Cas1